MNTNHTATRLPGSAPLKAAVAAVLGLAGGPVFFFLVHPLLLGEKPRPILNRGAFIYLLTRSFPLIVLPVTVMVTALLRPLSRWAAFAIALIFSSAFLIPVPVLDDWRVWPAMVGKSAFSRDVAIDLVYLLIYQLCLALIAGTASMFISPHLARWCRRSP